jgi:hypothetical protein
VHPSVLRQKQILPQLKANIDNNPTLISGLLPIEEEMYKNWPYVPGQNPPKDTKNKETSDDRMHKSFLNMAMQNGRELGHHVLHEITHTEIMRNASGSPVYQKSWLGQHGNETPFGQYIAEWSNKK